MVTSRPFFFLTVLFLAQDDVSGRPRPYSRRIVIGSLPFSVLTIATMRGVRILLLCVRGEQSQRIPYLLPEKRIVVPIS